MAMGNNPMMYTDADGRTWGIFKAVGQAWNYAWDKANQFAQWADEVGIPSYNIGIGMNSGGQVNPMVNGQPVNSGYSDPGVSASVSIDQQRSQYSTPTHTGITGSTVYTSPAISVGALIFNGAWSYYPDEEIFNYSLAQVVQRTWWEQSSGRVEVTDSPIDYLVGAGIGKAFLTGIEKGFVRATARGVSREIAAKGAGSAYDGVRAASSYLQKAGVPRAYRKQILQSFDVGSISLRTAGNSTYGLRFYGGAAGANGRYLFPTFTNYTSRTGLALPYRWNSMSGLRQFQIRPGSTYIYGRAASQGGIYSGGSYQMYINNLGNLIP